MAVDFAKHGECVSLTELEEVQKLLDKWPDFFEKPNSNIRISEGILGKLYREINNQKALKEFLKNEYIHSILLMYELDYAILNQV